MQNHFAHLYPRALYIRLSRYYDSTVLSVPHGLELLTYERQYYSFEQGAKAFEQKAIVQIGSLLTEKASYLWKAYFEYCFNRSAGFTADNIKKNVGNIDFGTYEQAETTCQTLMADPTFAPELNRLPQMTGQLDGAAIYLLTQYLGTNNSEP